MVVKMVLHGMMENVVNCHELKMVNKSVKFDIMIVIPIINYVFNIKKLKKLIPYANVFNTFSVSEYNGEFPPYTTIIGVGKGQLGLLFIVLQNNKILLKVHML